MTEKRVLIATLISAIFLAFYAQIVTRGMKPAPKTAENSSGSLVSSATMAEQNAASVLSQQFEQEDVISIESHDLVLTIGTSSGAIKQAGLKQFRNNHGRDPLLFGNGVPIVQLWPGDRPLTWKIKNHSESQVVLEGSDASGAQYELSYFLDANNPLVNITLEAQASSAVAELPVVTVSSAWMKGDQLSDRSNHLEIAIQQRAANGEKQKHLRFAAAHNKPRNVPRGTLLLALAERHFCHVTRFEDPGGSTTILPGKNGSVATATQVEFKHGTTGARRMTATVYLGPRDYFYLKKAGFEGAFPTGMFAQIGLILLMFLSWLAGLTHNYGIAIILFSVCVTCGMAPFTLMGFRSMRKMQALKPHMDRITSKHGGDQQKASPEIIALFKQHRVSPLGGCLPVLLQLPIFFALIQAISHYVEFRGKAFLWIQDLSLPDHLFHLPLSLPIIGSDFNLLPILTALAMFVQTKLSQAGMSTSQTDPSAKMMSGPMMPILFGVMFYQVPAGLVLYWLTNSLMSMLWMRVAKGDTTDIPAAA